MSPCLFCCVIRWSVCCPRCFTPSAWVGTATGAGLAAESERLAGADDVLAAVDGRHRSHQEHSYLARSRYELQLQRFEACFGADQIVLRRSEDLFERPEQVWFDLLHHLGLQQIPLPEKGRRAHVGSRGGDDLDEERLAELRDKLAMQLQPTISISSSTMACRGPEQASDHAEATVVFG